METKKISFGFSKLIKKPNLLPNKQASKDERKVELIKCLESQKIQLVEEKQIVAPLVIPMRENQHTSSALASLKRRREVLLGEDDQPQTVPESLDKTAEQKETHQNINSDGASTHDLEKRAELELLADVQSNGVDEEVSKLVLQVVKPEDLPLDGAKESTLNDYDNIPIKQFGMAMLRGMGWVDPPKKKGGPPTEEAPFLRPKGMGLGADKALKAKPLLMQPEANEVLEMKKNACVRILGGKFKDLYGQIEGFDDHASRVIVKLAIGGTKETFNEFMCQVVSRKEFSEYGKCINTAKYEEYKKLENEQGIIFSKKETEIDSKHRGSREGSRSSDNYKTVYNTKEQNVKEEISKNSRQCETPPSYYKEKVGRYERNRKQDEIKKHSEDVPRSQNNSRLIDDRTTNNRRRSRSLERRDRNQQSSSNSRRRPSSNTNDTSELSGTESSDTDSAYERRLKKKSSNRKSKSTKKSSKTRKAKTKHHRKHDSTTDNTDDSFSDIEDRNKHHKNRKHKKTKKSKKQRSRSQSRERR